VVDYKAIYDRALADERSSAGGPRGYNESDLHPELQPIRKFCKKRGRVPLNEEERVPKDDWP